MKKLKKEIADYIKYCERNGLGINNGNSLNRYFLEK